MNPICTDCNVEMRCRKNGVTVAHVETPHWTRKGDKFACPNCGTSVIHSLGEAYDTNVDVDVIIKEGISEAKVQVIQETIDWMDEL